MAAEVLSASDLNAEFNNILNNPVALWSPAAAAVDLDGQIITLDAAAATQVVSSAAISWNFTSGAKTGTPATTGSVANWSASTFTDNATAASGTAAAWVGTALQRPTLAATNALVTTTDAATHYIANAPLAGTNETITNAWALWVDAGNVRFDEDIIWLSGQTFAQRGILAHANTGIRTYTFPDADATLLYSGGALGTPASGTLTNCAGYPGTSLTVINAAGDIIYGTAADTATRLAIGTAGQLLRVNAGATAPEWGADLAASDTVVGNIEIAIQSEMEAGSDTGRAVTPGRQHFHPSAAKVWCQWSDTSTINSSYNVTSITDTGAGDWTVNFTTAFSGALYTPLVTLDISATTTMGGATRLSSSACQVLSKNTTGTLTDSTHESFAAFGDQ